MALVFNCLHLLGGNPALQGMRTVEYTAKLPSEEHPCPCRKPKPVIPSLGPGAPRSIGIATRFVISHHRGAAVVTQHCSESRISAEWPGCHASRSRRT